ncbi:hypothetical protein VTL71DRAFT_6708 [Oculimacula yallundae]|uniref:Glycosyltransferase 2-like domain-containing protein n=1 Tax=Oculimacula yallundae TaxID=86028 RepID=A0ABR4BYE5_9HELO
MASKQNIRLNWGSDNPTVAAYNAEPNCIAGVIQVGLLTANNCLGIVWLAVQLVLMLILLFWNYLLSYFPSLQFNDPENWPTAFKNGLWKIVAASGLNHPRNIIIFLSLLFGLYILISINMVFFRLFISRFDTVEGIPVDSPISPKSPKSLPSPKISPAEPNEPLAVLPNIFSRFVIYLCTAILNLISGFNRKAGNFFKSQGLNKAFILVCILALSYRAITWLGGPFTILAEPKALEWQAFDSAVRLSLYRAASLEFVVWGAFIIYSIREHGFKPFFAVLGSMLGIFVGVLSGVRAFMDTTSPEYQHASNTPPRRALPGDESSLTYLLGLLTVVPFGLIFSLIANQAHEKWLLIPRGPIKKNLLGFVMFFANIPAKIARGVWPFITVSPSPIESPTVSSRHNSEIEPPSSTNPFLIFFPTAESRQGMPFPITVPSEPVSPVVAPPAPASPTFPTSSIPPKISSVTQGDINDAINVESILTVIKYQLRMLVEGVLIQVQRGIQRFWAALVVLAVILAIIFVPSLNQNWWSILNQISTFASYSTSYLGETCEAIRQSLESVLPEPATMILQNDTFTGPSAPQAPFSPANPLISTSPVHFRPIAPSTRLGSIWAAFTGLIPKSAALLVNILGRSATNGILFVVSCVLLWLQGSSNRYLNSRFFANLLVSIPILLLGFQICEYLKRFEIFRALIEEHSGIKLASACFILIRMVKTLCHGRASVPPIARFVSRPGSIEYQPSDVTVIIPTKGHYCPEDMSSDRTISEREDSDSFLESLTTILANEPAEVILATTGLEAHKRMNVIAARYGTQRVKVTSIMDRDPSLRRQFTTASNSVQTDIVCYAHAHVRWEPNFLLDALAPFDNPDVGLVGVPVDLRRVRPRHSQYLRFNPAQFRYHCLQETVAGLPAHRLAKYLKYFPFRIMNLVRYTFTDGGLTHSFLNYLECIYYSRFNHESQRTLDIDGGISLVSAKTALIRTVILQSTAFRFTFPHEKILCGQFPKKGGMRSDAAQFITRKVREMGYQTAFQSTPATFVMADFKGSSPNAYCETMSARYSSLYRSNLASLHSNVWLQHFWTALTMLTGLFNIPLVIDGGLALLLWFQGFQRLCILFVLGVLTFRVYAQYPYARRFPGDWRCVLFGVGFYYLDSMFQIKGLLTAAYPDAEPEEVFVNVGYKGQYNAYRKEVI